MYQIFTIQRSKNPLIFGFCRPLPNSTIIIVRKNFCLEKLQRNLQRVWFTKAVRIRVRRELEKMLESLRKWVTVKFTICWENIFLVLRDHHARVECYSNCGRDVNSCYDNCPCYKRCPKGCPCDSYDCCEYNFDFSQVSICY